MSTRQRLLLICVSVLTACGLGCQPAPNHTINRTIGRNAYAPPNSTNGHSQSNRAGTTWGQVTSSQGDQAFDEQLNLMTLPMLDGAAADQQLGFVSATANQSTNVVFWGEASMYGGGGGISAGGNGNLDGSKARIHIEIWDDKAAQAGASPIVLHIGYDTADFAGASGSVQGNQVTLTFQHASYGAVAMQGTISGQTFTGTLYFQNSSTGGQFSSLGTFQVATCGFFVCQ